MRWRRRFRVHRLEGLARDAPRVHARNSRQPALAYRILRTTWDSPPAGAPRWSTRSLARALRVNHMLVHRVWTAHGILVPSSTGEIGIASERPPPEVVGVYLEGPAAIAIRLSGLEERFEATESIGSESRGSNPPSARSGGYALDDSVRSSLATLAALDRAYVSRRVGVADPGWSSAELFVFLRSVSERSRMPGDVHVFFDRPIPVGEARLDAWMATHPGVRFHDPDPAESWTVSIDRWLKSGPLRSVLEDRLRVGGHLDAALR